MAFVGASLPQEIADIIVDEVAEEPEPVLRVSTLRACSLISHTWVYRSQGHLFSKVEFNETGFRKWCASIRPGNVGPSQHVTNLRFNQDFGDSYLGDLVLADSHMSSFTNVRVLHVTNVSLQHEEIRSVLGNLGSTVSQLSLERCSMDIHHLTSFLHPFTSLEDLSLLDPHVLLGPKPEHPPKPLTAKGEINLELRIDMVHSGRSFVHELALLPVAVRTITLLECDPPMLVPWNYTVSPRTEINQLLAGSRETLTHFRVLADFAWGIDLTNVDALEELEFNVDQIHNTTHTLQTITSSKLALIVLNTNGNHHNYSNAWKRLDAALFSLIHRIESGQEPRDDGSRLYVKLSLGSNTYGCDVVESAHQLLPKCVECGYVTTFGSP